MSKATRKYCGTKSDIPKADHFAILEFTVVHTPGDERSRTHPGHGYPASSENMARYYAYTDRDEWEADVSEKAQGRDSGMYQALIVKVPKVITITKVVIE